MGNVYGGDEVGAIVWDIGSFETRVGYSGEDMPKFVLPSAVAVQDVLKNDQVVSSSNKERKFYFDIPSINSARPNKEIKTFVRDGMIDDWDLFEKMFEYVYRHCLKEDTTLHPIMFSEVSWNSNKCREQLAELIFEKFGTPAFYLANNAMLAAFSLGRPTALVFDSGAQHTAAVPIFEGHALTKVVKRNNFAGEYITKLCLKQLSEMKVEVAPYYMVKSKMPVKPFQPAKWVPNTIPEGLTNSWKNYMLVQEIRNYKDSVLKVFPHEFERKKAEQLYNKVNYHFPNGYNIDVSLEGQFSLTESLFNKNVNEIPSSLKYPDLILSSIAACDIDLRPLLLSTIVIAGGNTLFPGFTDRMNHELLALAPKNFRTKIIHNTTSPIERKFASWIGGSIMASLGTFQQLWLSKLEFEEKGKNLVHN